MDGVIINTHPFGQESAVLVVCKELVSFALFVGCFVDACPVFYMVNLESGNPQSAARHPERAALRWEV